MATCSGPIEYLPYRAAGTRSVFLILDDTLGSFRKSTVLFHLSVTSQKTVRTEEFPKSCEMPSHGTSVRRGMKFIDLNSLETAIPSPELDRRYFSVRPSRPAGPGDSDQCVSEAMKPSRLVEKFDRTIFLGQELKVDQRELGIGADNIDSQIVMHWRSPKRNVQEFAKESANYWLAKERAGSRSR